MAYFAKRIRYCANINFFVALIGIANKKGGKITSYEEISNVEKIKHIKINIVRGG